MCQPSPLGRCSTDALKVLEKSENAFNNAVQSERDLQGELKSAHANYNAVSGMVENLKYGKKERFGSEKDKNVREAGKEIKRTLAAWDKSKEKITETRREFLVKRMHYDTTPAGQEELLADTDNPDQQARLAVAEKVQKWQQEVAELEDAEGNKITSKKGKQSPEAKAIFRELYTNSIRGFKQAQKSFDTVNKNAIRASVKARNFSADFQQEIEDNPDLSDAQIQKKQAVVDEQKAIANCARLKMRTRKLEILMYEDRMAELLKIINKIK